LSRIVTLTVDRVGARNDAASLRFGVEDIELIEPLGGLVRRLVAERTGHANLIVSDMPWLFPGGRPGVNAHRIQQRAIIENGSRSVDPQSD
jgi:hypothetical protein